MTPEQAHDAIRQFYATKTASMKKAVPHGLRKGTVANLNYGLGDAISVSHLTTAAASIGEEICIASRSEHFAILKQFNPSFKEIAHRPPLVRVEVLQGEYSCGGGHFFQRIQRALGLPVMEVPRGTIVCHGERKANRVAMHLSVGEFATVQKRIIHPRARDLYPEHRQVIQEFVFANRQLEFWEFGTEFSGLNGVKNCCNTPLDMTIRNMAHCGWFLGLNSGVMHIAAALGLRGIVIINFPSARELYLPMLMDCPIVDADWLYPQFCHLHEDEGGELVPMMSPESLEAAFAGGIYPFLTPT